MANSSLDRSHRAAVCVALLSLLAASVAPAAESDDARAVVEELFDTLIEIAAIEPALDPDARYALLEPVVTEAYNLPRMGEVAAGRSWNSWSATERETFLETFVRLSVTQHTFRFASMTADMLEVLDSAPNDTSTAYDVATVIHRNNGEEDVALDYTVESDGGRWRIVNVVRDGTSSEVSSMRSSYRAILAESGLEGLLADLEDQIAECHSVRGCYRR